MVNRNSRAIFRLLQADGSISINKNLIHAIGLTESILYCELLSRYSYFEDREMLQEDGSFFNTIYDLQLGTGVSEKSQRTAIKNLIKFGLIECAVKGVPARRYFKINFECDVEDFIIKGEEKIQEIKELIATRQVKSTVQPKGETSSALKLKKNLLKAELIQPKGSGNNTKNNTNLNNTNHVVVEAYTNSKGKSITKAEKDKLIELSNTYSEELILKAIDMTVEQARDVNIKYIRTILQRFKAKGINTLEDIKTSSMKPTEANKPKRKAATSKNTWNNYENKRSIEDYTDSIEEVEEVEEDNIRVKDMIRSMREGKIEI